MSLIKLVGLISLLIGMAGPITYIELLYCSPKKKSGETDVQQAECENKIARFKQNVLLFVSLSSLILIAIMKSNS
jgi:hypothetical protein